jgi:hypothetical protein
MFEEPSQHHECFHVCSESSLLKKPKYKCLVTYSDSGSRQTLTVQSNVPALWTPLGQFLHRRGGLTATRMHFTAKLNHFLLLRRLFSTGFHRMRSRWHLQKEPGPCESRRQEERWLLTKLWCGRGVGKNPQLRHGCHLGFTDTGSDPYGLAKRSHMALWFLCLLSGFNYEAEMTSLPKSRFN